MRTALVILLFLLTLPARAEIEFDGTDDYIDCGTSLNPTGDITFAFWVKTSDGGTPGSADAMIYGGYNSSSPFNGFGVGIGIITGNKLGYFSNTHGSWVESASNVNDNTWKHLAITVENTSVKFYINGALDVTRTSARPSSFTGTKRIGVNPNLTLTFFAGQLAEVCVFTRALTINEIQSLAGKRRFVLTPGGAYWPLDSGPDGTSADGDTIFDRSGNGNNATGVDGANNTGLTWRASTFLSYPDDD